MEIEREPLLIYDFLQNVNEVGHPIYVEQNYLGDVAEGRFELYCYLETQEIAIFICREENPIEFENNENATIVLSTKLNHSEIGGKQYNVEGDYLIIRFEKPKLKIRHAIKKSLGDFIEKREHTRFFIENYQKSESIIIALDSEEQYQCQLRDLSRGGALFSFEPGVEPKLNVDSEVLIYHIAKVALENFTARVVHLKSDVDRPNVKLASLRFDGPLNMTKTLDIVRRCK